MNFVILNLLSHLPKKFFIFFLGLCISLALTSANIVNLALAAPGSPSSIHPSPKCEACLNRVDALHKAWNNAGCDDARIIHPSDYCKKSNMPPAFSDCYKYKVPNTPTVLSVQPDCTQLETTAYLKSSCDQCLNTCKGLPQDQQHDCSVSQCLNYGTDCQIPIEQSPDTLALNNFNSFQTIDGGFGFGCTPDPNNPGQCKAMDINGYIKDVIQYGGAVLGGLAVLKIIFGGVMYATAAGNPQRISDAKSHILYALLGIALIAGANIILVLFGAAQIR